MAKRISLDETPRGWAPTARDAVLACAPVASLFGALGLGGTGYLTHRPDLAACGALVGGLGMYAERLQARDVRRRARRDRSRFRTETAALMSTVDELRREVRAVRHDMDRMTSQHAAALAAARRAARPAPEARVLDLRPEVTAPPTPVRGIPATSWAPATWTRPSAEDLARSVAHWVHDAEPADDAPAAQPARAGAPGTSAWVQEREGRAVAPAPVAPGGEVAPAPSAAEAVLPAAPAPAVSILREAEASEGAGELEPVLVARPAASAPVSRTA